MVNFSKFFILNIMRSGLESNFIAKPYDMNCTSELQGKGLSCRRRSRNPELWLKSRRKKAILSGQSYTNTRGKIVSSKNIGPNCNCRNKCFHEVNEESRKKIFNGFYNLKSYDEQNSYLYGLIRRHAVLRKRHPNSVKRTCSYKYYVRIQGREVQVCKRAFASIHSISDKKIRTLCLKHEQNVMFPRDNRGRHCNRPKKVSSEVVRQVKQHIVAALSGSAAADFIKADKHHAPDVNVTKLYRNFLSQYEPQALAPDSDKLKKDYDAKVKPWVYFKVFHEEFKSLDLQTIKRKLSDMRRSLGANTAADDAKPEPPCSTSAGLTPVINVPTIDRQVTSSQSHQNITLVNTYSGAPDVASSSTASAAPRQQQQHVYYQQPLQPLNLQMLSTPTGVSTVSSSPSTLSSCASPAVLTPSSNVAITIPTNGQPYLFSLGPNLIPTATLNSSPPQFYAANVVPPCAIFAATPSPLACVSPKQTSLAPPPPSGTFVNVAPSLNASIPLNVDRSNYAVLDKSEKLVATPMSSEEISGPQNTRSARVLAAPLHISAHNASVIHTAPPLHSAVTQGIQGPLNATTTSLKILTPLNVATLPEVAASRDYSFHRFDSSGNIPSALNNAANNNNGGCRSQTSAAPACSQVYRSAAPPHDVHAPLNVVTLQNVRVPHNVHASQSVPVSQNFSSLTTINGVKAL